MALTVDGFATGATTVGNSCAVTLSTTNTNNIICVIASANAAGLNLNVTSVSDTAGLTWAKRKASNQTGQSYEFWWAYSSAALSSNVITVTWSGAPVGRTSAFGVNGANTVAPFDTDASLPALQYNASSTSCSNTISTANANTMLLAMVRGTGTAAASVPTSFTTLGSAGANENLSYRVVSSTQSSLVVGLSGWAAAQNSFIVDAIQQASTAKMPPIFQRMVI